MLIDGEIDLMSDLSYTPERNAPIALIGYSDYYFAVNKSEPELLVELNSAMRRIQSEEADYNSRRSTFRPLMRTRSSVRGK